MEYPDSHSNVKDIDSKKSEIDVLYKELKICQEKSREYYKFAMENLRGMGDEHKAIHEILQKIAEKMNELKEIVCRPLF